MRKSVLILQEDCLWDCNKVKALNFIFCWNFFPYQNTRKSICFTDKAVNFIKLEVLTTFQWTIWNSHWFSGKYEMALDSIYTCKQEKLPQSITHWMEQAQTHLKYVNEYTCKTFLINNNLIPPYSYSKTYSHYHTYLNNHLWIKGK